MISLNIFQKNIWFLNIQEYPWIRKPIKEPNQTIWLEKKNCKTRKKIKTTNVGKNKNLKDLAYQCQITRKNNTKKDVLASLGDGGEFPFFSKKKLEVSQLQ